MPRPERGVDDRRHPPAGSGGSGSNILPTLGRDLAVVEVTGGAFFVLHRRR